MNFKSLNKLDVRHNLFTEHSFSHVFPLLTKLKHLDLSENNLTDSFFRNLSLLIIEDQELKSSIEILVMESCGLTNHSLALLKTNLEWFSSLQKVDMKESDCNFDFKDIYQDILMRARYAKFEKRLDNKI
jgi:Leucine-rich repeat (LRR) protein